MSRTSFVFAALIATAAASTALAADANKFSGFKAENVTTLGLSSQNNATLTGLTAEGATGGVVTQSFSGGELFTVAKGGSLADDATVAKYADSKTDLFAAGSKAANLVSK